MDLKEIKKVIALCKKEGLLVFKNEELELHFNPHAQPKTRKTKAKPASEHIPVTGEFTEEEILNWSVPNVGHG